MFRPRLCAVEHADLCGSRPLAPPPIRSSRRGTSPRLDHGTRGRVKGCARSREEPRSSCTGTSWGG
jgi:hypothetical protein